MAEREGFPACEYAACTPCCWEGHSALCYAAYDWQGKSDIRHSAVNRLDLRSGPSWTNRTNKAKTSSLPAILCWFNHRLHQPLISGFGEPTTEVHAFLFARHPAQSRFLRVGGLHNHGPAPLSRTDPGVGGPVLGIARVNSFEGDW